MKRAGKYAVVASRIRLLYNLLFPCVYILNLFDLLMTVKLVNRFGLGAEANPIGVFLFREPFRLFFTKIGIIGAAVLFLYSQRRKKAAAVGIITAFAVYASLCLCHVTLAYYVMKIL